MVVGASVGTGLGAENRRSLFQLLRTGTNGGSGMVVGWIFGTEAGVGWTGSWWKLELKIVFFVAGDIHTSSALLVPS